GIVAAALAGDGVARTLVQRLADEIVLLARRAMAELHLREADVVLGGGMLASGEGLLYELVAAALPEGARPVTPELPPVAGAALAAFDALKRPDAAGSFRAGFRDWRPGSVVG